MSERTRRLLPPLSAACIVLLYVAFGSVYQTRERCNQDEGWYLYAARLVGEGQRPYVDFAYVQPPLLPYVYHLLGGDGSMEAGRGVSLLFGALAVLLVIAAGWRSGPVGGLTAGALFAFTPFVLSQQSLVKAYALADACLALGLAAAVHARGRRGWLAVAAIGFALAGLARNSVASALPVLWLWQLSGKERRRGLLVSVPVGLGLVAVAMLPFLLADAAAVRHHLLAHHAQNLAHGEASMSVTGALLFRVLTLLQIMIHTCPALSTALLGGLAAWLLTDTRREQGAELGLAAALTVVLAVGHFVSSHPYQEYQVLALPSAAVLAGLAWGELLARSREPRVAGAVLLALAAVVPLLSIGPAVAGLPGNRRGPDGTIDPRGVFGPLHRVADEVRRRTGPDDELFSFQTDVAVEARRRLSPGLTLASFSFTDDPEAERWKMVNPRSITSTFERATPAAVVLSGGDLAYLFHAKLEGGQVVLEPGLGASAVATYGPLVDALNRNYVLVAQFDNVGQFFETWSVFARRAP
ncbi:MAG: glycosyltransferase family 39 protein [Armatimonadetes bacterium]|nr:glycosyltransferase family 39 protein [Armatimonadota bacterium]